MLRHLLHALLHKLGLCARTEYDDLIRGANEAIQAIAHETARASVYAAALVHNDVVEPHLAITAGAVRDHAETWLNRGLGRGSGDVLTGARDLLAAVDRHTAQLDAAAFERIQDALVDLDVAASWHAAMDKVFFGDPDQPVQPLTGLINGDYTTAESLETPTKARGIDSHWMDDLAAVNRTTPIGDDYPAGPILQPRGFIDLHSSAARGHVHVDKATS